VKWKGYLNEEATWEAASSLEHAQQKVKEFHKQKPSALQPILLNAVQLIS